MDEKTLAPIQTLIEAVAEYGDPEEAIMQMQKKPYAAELQANSLDPDELSLAQLTTAMETAAFLGLQFDSLSDEWLFRIGRNDERIDLHYEQVYGTRYTLKAPVSGVIANALKLRYGSPPYAPWHLNFAICLNTSAHAAEAARVHNYALFRRCSGSPEDAISDLKCFKYATRDTIWHPWVAKGYFELAVNKLSFKVARYILEKEQTFRVRIATLSTIIALDFELLELLIREKRFSEETLNGVYADVFCKYPSQLQLLLEAKYSFTEQTVMSIYNIILHNIYPADALGHLINAGYKMPDHIRTTVYTFDTINLSLLEFLVSNGVPMSNLHFLPHLVSNMYQIELLDKLGFKWQDHFFHMMHSKLPDVYPDVSRALLERCKWADYTYYHYILNFCYPDMIKLMHEYATAHDPAKRLAPGILLDVKNAIIPADWTFYTALVRPQNCCNCHNYPPAPKICSRCRMATYCDQVCQKIHWPQHKHNCA